MRDNSILNLIRCCEILEIQPDASPDEAKQSFRDLVSIWHPDKYRHNSRLMEKADHKLKEINWAWEQFQTLSREQEHAGEKQCQCEQEVAERQLKQQVKSLTKPAEFRPVDLDIKTTISAEQAQQAYRALLRGALTYDPDPGLTKQEEISVLSVPDAAGSNNAGNSGGNLRSAVRGAVVGYDLLKEAVASHVQRNHQEYDSLKRSVQVLGLTCKDRSHDPQRESTREISRKMQLLSECYVQERREKEIQERQERDKLKRELLKNEERVRREQKQKHRILTERFLEKYHSWLADEKEKFHTAELERQHKTGIYRILRGVERQQEFPFGIPHVRMIFLAGGTFAMGRDDRSSLFSKLIGHTNSHPRHTVTIRDYYLSKYPVTEKQWSRAMGMETPEHSLNLPALLCWSDVQKFIGRLNEVTGLSFRLPTEAEWEYAARSGGKDEKWPGEHGGSKILEHAAVGRSQVGQHLPNGLGLYDMLGNVGEWSGDWYDPKYYTSSIELDPLGPEQGDRKVIRGNVFFDAIGNLMIADSFSRNSLPVTRSHRAGFRLAHSLL